MQSAAIYRSSDSSQVPPVGLETIFRSTRRVTEIFNEKKFFFWGRKCVAWRNRPVVNGAADPLTANVITLNLNRFFLYFFNLKEKSNFKTETRWSLKVTLIALYFSGIPVASAHTGSPGTGPLTTVANGSCGGT